MTQIEHINAKGLETIIQQIKIILYRHSKFIKSHKNEIYLNIGHF